MKDVMVMYENGEPVTTPDGRGPGFCGCLNDFDRAVIGMINKVRSVHVYGVETVI